MTPQEEAKIIHENEGLVRHICRPFLRRGRDDAEDLLQEGRLGLLEAVRTFDPSLGVKWSTWAGNRISWGVFRYLNQSRTPPALSLDAPLEGEGGEENSLLDLVADPRESPELEALDKIEREQVLACLDFPREKELIARRLVGRESLEDIGRREGRSRECIRKRQALALAKLESRGAWD